MLRATYEELRNRNVRYGHEPWTADRRGQRIRPPEDFIHDKGTCLDLAMAFAAMCELAQVRPILAFTPGHALVVADVQAPFNDTPDDPGAPLVFDRFDDLFRLVRDAPWPDHLIAVDVALAARNAGAPSADFDVACQSGLKLLLAHSTDVKLVDVATARRDHPKAAALPAPPDREDGAWPAISTRLPTPPEFISYPSRAAAKEALDASTGIVVLHGESGMGKSVLAYARAAAADHGYGWILTATDQQTLTAQLAESEREERPAGRGAEVYDRTALAAAARARLRGTSAPWVVVLDNANCTPGQLRTLLPRPKPGQTLIITTTNPAWLPPEHDPDSHDVVTFRPSWAGIDEVTVIPLLGVTPDELVDPAVGAPPPDVVDAIAGSPLISRGVNAAISNGAEVTNEVDVSSGGSLLWALARQVLSKLTPSLRENAHSIASLMSWLPSEPQRLDILAALGGTTDEAADIVGILRKAGLVTVDVSDAATMHRLVQAAIRESPDSASSDPVAGILGNDLGIRLLIRQADGSLLDQMKTHLESLERDPSVSVGTSWYGLGRVHEYRWSVPTSALHYARALDRESELTAEAASACWLGQARPVYQNADARTEEITDALAWVARAKASALLGDSVKGRLAFQRARAMEALLMRKEADALATKNDIKGARSLLTTSIEILQESLDERRAILTTNPELDLDDEDRAIFNFAGNYLALAKISTGSEVETYFAECEETYVRVLEIREARYGKVAIPHIASCKAGLMMKFYYQALHDQPGSPNEEDPNQPAWLERKERRTAALREATVHGMAALADREKFEGLLDAGDSSKSTAFMAKIMLVRAAIAAGKKSPLLTSDAIVVDFHGEAESARIL